MDRHVVTNPICLCVPTKLVVLDQGNHTFCLYMKCWIQNVCLAHIYKVNYWLVVFRAITAHLGSVACFVYEVMMNMERMSVWCTPRRWVVFRDCMNHGLLVLCVRWWIQNVSVNKSVVLRACRHGLFVMLFVCVSTLCMCDNVSMVCKLVTRHSNIHMENITLLVHYTQDNLCFCGLSPVMKTFHLTSWQLCGSLHLG